MPRPKRTKVASTSTTSRVATATKTSATQLKTTATRVASQSASESGTVPSDDSDGLVTSKPAGRAARSQGRARQELYMTGAVQEGDVKGAHVKNKRPGRAVKQSALGEAQKKTLEALQARRDAAKAAEKAQKVAEKEAREEPVANKPVSAVVASTPLRRAGRSPATRARDKIAASESNASGTGAEDSDPSLPSPSLGDLSVDSPQSIRRPQSALKARGTPGIESSILNLANFKRRPRQPSILRMVQQADDSAGSDDDDDLDLENFNPEDESTPMPAKVTSTIAVSSSHNNNNDTEVRSSSSRKRRRSHLSAVEVPTAESSSSIQVRQSPDLYDPPSSPPPRSSPARARDRQTSPPASQTSSLPSRVPQTQPELDAPATRSPTPEILSQTMAPPLSSSPDPSPHSTAHQPPASPPRQRARKKRTNTTTTAGTTRAPKTITTSTLQSLLPKRRTKPRDQRDEFDIFSSSSGPVEDDDDDDDDELSRPNKRTVQKTPAAATKKMRTPLRAKNANSTTANSTRKAAAGKNAKSSTATSKSKSKRTSTTYSRLPSHSNAENENEPSAFSPAPESPAGSDIEEGNSSTLLDAKATKKMEAVARKFAEVDEWEFAVESVDVGGESSSPWR